ncbi:FecR domain-containing protein [Pedobacter sp. BS3]|uniref:FecR domain-containing protein n=1 Tax=Pedobacter sp. BS3 TaxID=2567937 RepID=UPI001658E657|nr:FecR domain-containing protein [Pedobacter sp. BS3]
MPSDQYKRIEQLLEKYRDKSISYEEYLELFEYIGNKEYKKAIFEIMDQRYRTLNPDADVHDIDWDNMYRQIAHENGHGKNSFWRPLRYLAAAVTLIIISYSIHKFYIRNSVKGTENQVAVTDVAPGSDKATLTLSDGSRLELNENKKGELAEQGVTRINQVSGAITYVPENTDVTAQDVMFNTLTTPRGGKYHVVLSDGSKVWLNAESSLTFPAHFSGPQRKVILTGEGYFEVAKNKEMPFIVEVGDAQVKVLGTHFNIMAYQDEKVLKTTLLEGSINFSRNNQNRVIAPGQQVQYTVDKQGFTIYKADMEAAMAWKNGLFVFNDTRIDDIMKSIQRWYNVDVVYNNDKPDISYTGVIPRSANLSKVLTVLESAGNVKFEIKGNMVTCSKK